MSALSCIENYCRIKTMAKIKLYILCIFILRKLNVSSNHYSSSVARLLKYYPQIDLKIIFVNSNSIGNFFSFKDRVQTLLQSNLVYRYTCPQCNACYVGETSRHLRTRIAEHRGLSPRTYKPVMKTNSRIFDHYLETGHDVCESAFEKIISAKFHLKTVESIVIKKLNPKLNTQNSSVPLNIL